MLQDEQCNNFSFFEKQLLQTFARFSSSTTVTYG